MTESQEEIQTDDTTPIDEPVDALDALRSENEGLKVRLADAQATGLEAGLRLIVRND